MNWVIANLAGEPVAPIFSSKRRALRHLHRADRVLVFTTIPGFPLDELALVERAWCVRNGPEPDRFLVGTEEAIDRHVEAVAGLFQALEEWTE